MQIFIASKLRNTRQQKLNEKIYNLCLQLGYTVFFSQKKLPLEIQITPCEILETNEQAVNSSDLVVVIFDRADCGSAMELERAYVLRKTIIGYRSTASQKNENIGKMMQGAWDRIPIQLKTSSLKELKNILRLLFTA